MARIAPEKLGDAYDAHAASLNLFARQWLDADAAADVVQAAFVSLAAQARQPASLKAWLFAAVRNGAVSQLRSRKVRREHEPAVSAARPEWFEANLDDRLDGMAAQQAMLSLPAAQRELVVLRIWGGLTLAEAAQVVDQPLSTVFWRYKAALEEIRKRMVKPCQKKD